MLIASLEKCGTGAVVVLIEGGERKMNVERLTGLGVEKITSLVREKQEG